MRKWILNTTRAAYDNMWLNGKGPGERPLAVVKCFFWVWVCHILKCNEKDIKGDTHEKSLVE